MIISSSILVLVLCHIKMVTTTESGHENIYQKKSLKLPSFKIGDILPVNAIFVFDIDKLQILSLESEWKREMLGLFILDIFEKYI